MKKIIFLSTLLFSLMMSGCLVYKQMAVTITFAEDFVSGKIEVVYTDLASSDSSLEKQNSDFKDLIAMLEEDEFLLDSVNDGIYVKQRRLYEENGKLNAAYSGIFQKLKLDSEELEEKGEDRILHIDTDEGDIVTSNGKILQGKDNTVIIWPKSERKLHFTVQKNYKQPVYSLLSLYRSK